MGQVSVGFRPEEFGEPPLGHPASAESDQRLEERQRLLLHFPTEFDGPVIHQESEPSQRVDLHRPRPLLQVRIRRVRRKTVPPDEFPDVVDLDPLFERFCGDLFEHVLHPERCSEEPGFATDLQALP